MPLEVRPQRPSGEELPLAALTLVVEMLRLVHMVVVHWPHAYKLSKVLLIVSFLHIYMKCHLYHSLNSIHAAIPQNSFILFASCTFLYILAHTDVINFQDYDDILINGGHKLSSCWKTYHQSSVVRGMLV